MRSTFLVHYVIDDQNVIDNSFQTILRMPTWRLDTATVKDTPALLQSTGRCAVNDRRTLLNSLAHGYGS